VNSDMVDGIALPRRRAIRLGLITVCLTYLGLVLSLHPARFFGFLQDDTIYFSSAKALAQGQGYVLPSVPGTPRATKYPILLPWLQSWIWKFDSNFPQNVRYAIGLNLCFGMLYIFLAYRFILQMKYFSDVETLILAAFCAFHPVVLFFSANVMSDLPFAALVLASLLAAERALSQTDRLWFYAVAGALAGVTGLMRLAGMPIFLGILLSFVIRRAWRGAALFVAGFVPALFVLYKISMAGPSVPPVPFSPALPGWTQTWLYYTSYVGFRKLESHSVSNALELGFNQFLYLLFQIPEYFVSPLSRQNIVFWLFSSIFILGLMFRSIRKSVVTSDLPPTAMAFVIYALTLLLWDYPAWDRFLLPFLPLFSAMLWKEMRQLGRRAYTDRRAPKSSSRFLLSASVGLVVVGMAATVTWNFLISGPQSVSHFSAMRGYSLEERLEAYSWIRQNVPAESVVMASEDALLYLYTDRQSLSLTSIPVADVYDSDRLRRDLDHLADPAIALRASYWLTFDDEAQRELNAVRSELAAHRREWESKLSPVFRSSRGTVRIYDRQAFLAGGR
jgi:hypothetical protein